MKTTSASFEHTAGRFFLVTGLSSGREIFLGRAVSEPVEQHLFLQGKVVSRLPHGGVVARPFASTMSFFLLDSSYAVQQVSDPRVQDELERFEEFTHTRISPTVFPQLHQWFRSAFTPEDLEVQLALESTALRGEFHPFRAMLDEFQSTAEQFRRSLFHARQVQTTRELDKVAELEGDLLVEVGKLTNQAAIRFNGLLARETELFQHVEACGGDDYLESVTTHGMGGFVHLLERLYLAKSYARRSGQAAIVREVNSVVRDAFSAFTETVFEHANALDTLMTETFSQYGIAVEIHGDFSSDQAFSSPVPVTKSTRRIVAQSAVSGV